MTDKYVATTGSNSNPGTLASPYLTIRKGIENTVAGNGDTVWIRGGTYAESISTEVYTIPSGSSFTNALTVRGYNGETVILAPTSGHGIRITGNTHYVIFRDFILDGSACTEDLVSIGDNDATNVPGYIRLQVLEIKNGTDLNGILCWTGSGRVGLGHNEVITCHVRNCGGSTFAHGIYFTVPDCLIDGGEINNNGAFGIHVFANASFPLERTHNTLVRNVRSRNNIDAGILITGGNNLRCFNSIAHNNGGDGIQSEFGASCIGTLVYNNTCYGNAGDGIRIAGNNTNAQIKNCISYSNGTAISNAGSATVQSNNLTSNPLFIDASAGDFRLQEGSPAIDAAVDLSAYFLTDFYGHYRG